MNLYAGQVGDIIPVPRLASAVTLARGPRPWRGFTRGPFNNTANCPLRDYTTQKRWPKKLDNSRCVLYTKSNTLYYILLSFNG